MRIHQLSIQAFGPFAGTEQINFDELGNAGLFLLDGPTGAGKSSILDAICYAIYGSLPGNRQGSRQIRSDHAAAGLNPEVCLELSIGERRFEVTRSPAWMRPAKRGKNKTTEEKAKSSLREYVDGQWEALSTRNDEVGQALGAALSLDREQFTKVVMLPQGGFADFLRAKDTEREKLLARLFDTSDYAQIEEEFAARLSTERKNTEAIEAELSALENLVRNDALRALNTAGVEPAAADEPDPNFDQLEHDLKTVESQCAELSAARKTEFGVVTAQHTQLENRRRIFERWGELQQIQQEHAQAAESAAAASVELELDRKAISVRAYQQQVQEATRTQQDADSQVHAAFAELTGQESPRVLEKDDATLSQLAAERDELTGKISVIRAALPDEEQRSELAQTLLRLQQQAAQQAAKAQEADAEATELRTQRDHLETQDLDLLAAAATVNTAEQGVTAAKQAVEQTKKRDLAADKLAAAIDQRRLHADALGEKQQEHLHTQRQLLAQGAARLAANLKPGQACLVCGSTEHPQPATAAPGLQLVTEEELDVLEAALNAQRELVGSHDVKVESARTTHQNLVELVGQLTKHEAAEQLAEAKTALKQATENQEQISARVARVAQLTEQIQRITEQATSAKLASVTATEQLGAAQEQLQQLDTRLAALRGEHDSLAQLLKLTESQHRMVSRSHQSLDRWLEAVAAAVKADQRWNTERNAAGFQTDDHYQAVLLESATRSNYELLEKNQQRRSTTIETLSASSDIAQALQLQEQGIAAPTTEDMTELAATLVAAEERYELARQAHVVASSAVRRLQEGRSQLARRIEQTGPVIEGFRRLKGLAEVVRGGGENRLKMTLSTYVLAARLEEVAAAATERLQVMSSQRYSLHHDDSTRGNAKSGLGIRVHDAWTGRDRETQTLSGGETFMASLALALGLADVISHHSGAVDMQTLFVDEGFGSLDTETLELVMESLEALRSGGRVIGVVSHVSEMKQRITNRLTVEKSREGSTILSSADEMLLG